MLGIEIWQFSLFLENEHISDSEPLFFVVGRDDIWPFHLPVLLVKPSCVDFNQKDLDFFENREFRATVL